MSKIRKSAQGEACQVRIPGVCNGNPETVVLAHMNGSGMALKALDLHAAYACSSCHDEIDRRTQKHTGDLVQLWFYEGIFRTQKILFAKGLITCQ